MALIKLLLGVVNKIKMAIHDTDKNSSDRNSPMPNSHDLAGEARPAAGTTSVHPVTGATLSSVVLRSKNAQVALNDGTRDVAIYGVQADGSISLKFFDSSGIGIAQFGKFADGSTALKVAKPGFEVSTTADANLIFNSAQDVFKIVQVGTAQLTVNSIAAGATQTVSVSHGLGVVPGFMSFIQMPSNAPNNNVPTGYLCLPQLWAISNAAAMWFSARVDTTNIYFDVTNTATGTSTGPWVFNYKFYILQETAA